MSLASKFLHTTQFSGHVFHDLMHSFQTQSSSYPIRLSYKLVMLCELPRLREPIVFRTLQTDHNLVYEVIFQREETGRVVPCSRCFTNTLELSNL